MRWIVVFLLCVHSAAAAPNQWVGGSIGSEFAGGMNAGGLVLGGDYLYRLSSSDWFDSRASLRVGASSPVCYYNRTGSRTCRPGVLDGVGLSATMRIRRWFVSESSYQPFASVGFIVEWLRFSDDDLSGFSLPLTVGGGVTRSVGKVQVHATGQVNAGPGHFSGIGWRPVVGLGFSIGVLYSI